LCFILPNIRNYFNVCKIRLFSSPIIIGGVRLDSSSMSHPALVWCNSCSFSNEFTGNCSGDFGFDVGFFFESLFPTEEVCDTLNEDVN